MQAFAFKIDTHVEQNWHYKHIKQQQQLNV